MSKQETKTCQNCDDQFVIDGSDFDFYKKIDVPPPTFCPECRMQRRMAWRNDWRLFKKKDAITGEEIFSIFPPESRVKVVDREYWLSDQWDPLEYGRDYDFSKPFFEQFKELLHECPTPAQSVIELQNCEYCLNSGWAKNCYLVAGVVNTEDSMYLVWDAGSRQCSDSHMTEKCELGYDNVNVKNSYRTIGSVDCDDCSNAIFSKDCKGCTDCFGCVGLRNKSYHIFNKAYSKKEYQEAIEKYNLGSKTKFSELQNRAHEFWLSFPRKYMVGRQNANVTGDYIFNSKNAKNCYRVTGAEDVRYCQNLLNASTRDCYDYNNWGQNAELVYESLMVGDNAYDLKFSNQSYSGSQRLQLCYFCNNASDLFGCVSVRNKKYCILNKEYSKEEYEALVPKIIEHMNKMPYIDTAGREYRYGEFFPAELSPYGYNISAAGEFYPLSREEAKNQGYPWTEEKKKDYMVSIRANDLPDDIANVKDDILEKTIQCAHEGKCKHPCSTAFKIIAQELAFYRNLNLPLPHLCFNCRHSIRLAERNGPKLYSRSCQCAGDKSDPPSRTGIKNKELGIKEFATDIETNQQPTTDNLQQGTEDIDNKESKTRDTYTNTSKNHPDHAPDEHCPNEFQTSYSPDRPEIIYCENCYQNEVT